MMLVLLLIVLIFLILLICLMLVGKAELLLLGTGVLTLKLCYFFPNIMNLLWFFNPGHVPWMISLVYGSTVWHEKNLFLAKMDQLAAAFDGARLCLGDFNSVG